MQAVSISDLKHNPAEALRQAKSGPLVVLNCDDPDALLIGLEQGGLLQAPGVRAALATALFRDGELSLARSARVAEMDVASFIEHLGRLGIPGAPVGLIPSARAVFTEQLHASDFRIAPEVIQAVLKRCGDEVPRLHRGGPLSRSWWSCRWGRTTESGFQQVFEHLATGQSIDAEIAAIERRNAAQPMLMGQPEQGGIGQIHGQIAVLPHPSRHQLQRGPTQLRNAQATDRHPPEKAGG